MKKRKILFIGLIVILGILGTVRVFIYKYVPVTIVRIPQEIKFTNEYDPDAYLCLPAAYTSVDDTIEGSYRVDGKINGTKSLKEYISIHPTKGLLIGKNGIQIMDSNNTF